MNDRRLSYREISLFFFPLILNVQLMSISHTIINGALARLDNYVTALAGISVAMVVHLFIASPSYQNHTVTLAMARDRRSIFGVLLFIFLVGSYVSIMLALITYTRVGELVLIKLLGVPPDVADEARRALQFMVLLPFISSLRSFCQGLLLRIRKTGLISLATGIRVGALFIYLAIGRYWFSGAQLGAFALFSCVTTESMVIAFCTWRMRSQISFDGPEKSVHEILSFAFPLALSSCLQQTSHLVISGILGRLPDASLALAAFGVIRGFLFLLAGPMRNLQQAYMALVKRPGDGRILFRFGFMLATGLGILLLLTAAPLNEPILGRLMGVEQELRHYLTGALALCSLYPLFYGGCHLLRGWFSAREKTRLLGGATLIKSIFLLLLWLPLVRLPIPLPGILIGIGLLVSAEALEAGYLLIRQRRIASEGQDLARR